MNERIKLIRKTLGLTQKEFGARVGVAGKHVGAWESGERGLTGSRVYQICNEFKVRREWFETGEGEMFARPTKNELYVRAFTALYESLTPEFQEVFLEIAKEKLGLDRSVSRTQINNGNVEGDMIQN